jgi:NADH:ubiquinone oxidoreductase subunit 6 (subunit J)
MDLLLFLSNGVRFLLVEIPDITASVALGLLAVYLLVPRPRNYPPLLGVVAAGLALILAGVFLIHGGAVAVETLLFYAFSGIAVIAGGLLVTQRNPVYAALSFALVVLSTCGLFLLQAAPFLMAATIIIYAGAIIVTFIFVIMLAQQAGLSNADARSREPELACVAGFVLLGALLFVLRSSYDTSDFDALLDRTARASEQSTSQGIRETLGDEKDYFDRFHREIQRPRGSPETNRLFVEALGNVEFHWTQREMDVEKMKESLSRLHDIGIEVRNSTGSLQTPAPMPEPGQRRQRPQLPAENVAHLGRLLFTDYLVPVEMGGTLLLVATIGAIAITGRRAEGLR